MRVSEGLQSDRRCRGRCQLHLFSTFRVPETGKRMQLLGAGLTVEAFAQVRRLGRHCFIAVGHCLHLILGFCAADSGKWMQLLGWGCLTGLFAQVRGVGPFGAVDYCICFPRFGSRRPENGCS